MNLKFEGIDTPGNATGATVPNGYGNLSWTNVTAIDPRGGDYAVSGFTNGTVSGHSVAFNTFASPALLTSSSGDFTLTKGFFTGAWNNGLTVTVKAFDNGVEIGEKVFTVDYDAPSKIKFGSHFQSIDQVRISSSGGTDANGSDAGFGAYVAFDNLAIEFDTLDAPEPRHRHDEHVDRAHSDLAHDFFAMPHLYESGFLDWPLA